MYQAYAQELLNQKEFRKADSGQNGDSGQNMASIDLGYSSMPENHQHPLYVATRRLVNALDRLENNLKQVMVSYDRDVHQEQQMVYFERENAALKQERENLNAAIAQLQYQYNDLHKIASTIYGKLDDSIKRLSQIIEE
jgi:hypothetical protein